MTAPAPAVQFVELARQQPTSAHQQPANRTNNPETNVLVCQVCLAPLRPNQTHVPGGFECRQTTGQL